MYELKNMERYLRVNLLGPGPRLVGKEFTGPWSDKVREALICPVQTARFLVQTARFPVQTARFPASQDCSQHI